MAIHIACTTGEQVSPEELLGEDAPDRAETNADRIAEAERQIEAGRAARPQLTVGERTGETLA